MNVKEYRIVAGQLESALHREQAIKEEIREIEAALKERANITNPKVAATKRVLKAKAKGTLDELADKLSDDQAIFDLLTNPIAEKHIEEKNCEKLTEQFDPDTGRSSKQNPLRRTWPRMAPKFPRTRLPLYRHGTRPRTGIASPKKYRLPHLTGVSGEHPRQKTKAGMTSSRRRRAQCPVTWKSVMSTGPIPATPRFHIKHDAQRNHRG